jgi:hypothetical protein
MDKPRKRSVRIPRLNSVARVGAEIGKLYRLMRHEELNTPDGMRMVQTLLGLKACLETCEIETRLKAIEEAVNGRKPPVKLLSFPDAKPDRSE